MSSAVVDLPPESPFTTVAELQAHLGGIPAQRIRLRPPPGTATEADLLAVRARENRLCELIDGVLVEKVMATFESCLAGVLIYFLQLYLEDHDIGQVFGEGGYLRLFPGRVRAPDVSFVAWKRMPNEELPHEAIASLSPDLAVEILSDSNTPAEMESKRRDYFRSGTKLVWQVDPKAKTVEVWTSLKKAVVLTESDTLDGGKVLPGFTLPIAQWFQRASRKRRK